MRVVVQAHEVFCAWCFGHFQVEALSNQWKLKNKLSSTKELNNQIILNLISKHRNNIVTNINEKLYRQVANTLDANDEMGEFEPYYEQYQFAVDH